jgi:UDP-glucose 4-epimerase
MHTARRFLREGYPVLIYDVYSGGVGDFFEGLPALTHVQGDVNDFDKFMDTVDRYKVEGMVHVSLAYGAIDAHKELNGSFKETVEGTFRFLEVARAKNLRLVCVSSQAVYGRRPDLKPIKEDDPLSPNTVYSCWKAMTDLMCLTYHQVFHVDLSVIRTSFVYGPHRRKRAHLADTWLRKALAGEEIEIPAMAEHQIDWTYAEDVAQGIFKAYSVRPLKHRIFNISQGKNTTLSELAQAIKDVVPTAKIVRKNDKSEYFDNVVPLRGPGDISRAREELGYAPQYTIQKGVAALLDWITNKEPLLKEK